MRQSIVGITAAIVLLTANLDLFAQTTMGNILGAATDPTGAAVPGVSVTVRNLGTGMRTKPLRAKTGSTRSHT